MWGTPTQAESAAHNSIHSLTMVAEHGVGSAVLGADVATLRAC